MQTDLSSLNLWEEKYENKAVLVALNNDLHFFFCDNNCDNYHLLWDFFFIPSKVLIFNPQRLELSRFYN